VTANACINRIGTARPPYEVHDTFVGWAEAQATPGRDRALFRRMAARAGIDRRWSVLPPAGGASQVVGGFYAGGMPSTAARMKVYAAAAPPLALAAVEGLGTLGMITHLVVASCTGFMAPGLDQVLAERLGLPRTVQRAVIGFMGCYAGAVALRTAQQIVLADPEARVLVVAIELTTLHLQGTGEVEALLAMLQFGDGAAAAIVSAEPVGLALTRFASVALPDSGGLMSWAIGDEGFVMELAGAVPGRIADALGDAEIAAALIGPERPDAWAVHPGGRSVLDAVERAAALPAEALAHSRDVLAEGGNMSSATLLFVLDRFLQGAPVARGIGLAFGPGLAAEAIGFRSMP